MKFSTLAIVCLASTQAGAFAPQSMSPSPRAASSLHMKQPNEPKNWGTVVTSALVGLTFAAQASFAAIDAPFGHHISGASWVSESTTSTVAVETMDFSMPSYGDAVKDTVKSKAAPPAFNPFGDALDKMDDEAEKKKAEPEKPKLLPMPELKLDVPAKSEEPKAPAPPKVEPVKEEKKAEPAKEMEIPKFEAPKFDAPKVDIPKFDGPKFDAPKFDAPKFDSPKFDAPKFDAPKFEAPKFDAPKIDIPKFDAPKFDAPKFDMPSISTPGGSSTPSYDFDIPKVSIPSAPKISNPFSSGGGSSSTDPDIPLEPREVRDEKARQTKQDFLAADADVKEAEKVLNALKEVKKAKKQVADEAKDRACADRPGGKYLCLRNPFSSGF